MSGGYFDSSEWVIKNLAEDLQGFVDKQLMYSHGKVNPHLPTGDWDHELSERTLRRVQSLAHEMKEIAEKFKDVDYLLSSDISEESFNKDWDRKGY